MLNHRKQCTNCMKYGTKAYGRVGVYGQGMTVVVRKLSFAGAQW